MGEGSGTDRGQSRSRRRRRSRGRSRGRGTNSPAQQDNRGNTGPPKGNRSRSKHGRGSTGNGVRSADNNTPCLGAERYFSGELNAFELFCAYHLGLDRDGAVRNNNLVDVARRFNTDKAAIDAALLEFNMDRDKIKRAAFDLEMARLDVEVVPPGVDRVEVARSIYGDFLAAGLGLGPLPSGRTLPSSNPEPETD